MPNKEVIIRIIASIIAIVNLILVKSGKIHTELAESEVYTIASYIAVIVIWVWTFWKNNSFTPEAKKADEYMKELKGERNEY